MAQTKAYVLNFDYGTSLDPNIRPGVFLTAPDNLETLRSAGKVITISVNEGLTGEQFIRGVTDIAMQVALSPFDDVIGEVIINSGS